MKNLKIKLMTSVVMLLVAAIALSTASYAWFTISTNPEITGMEATVVVNENLEIAYVAKTSTEPSKIPGVSALGDTGTYTTWGNLVELTATELTETTLRPATLTAADGTNKSKFQYPTYGEDGRPETDLTDISFGATNSWGFGVLRDTDNDKAYGYYIDFWVRSNMSGNLELSAAVNRSTDGKEGDGSYFRSSHSEDTDLTDDAKSAIVDLLKNIRIAFKDITPANVGNAEAAAATADYVVATNSLANDDDAAFDDDAEFTCDNIVALTANNAKLIRMVVYLEGANVTNASASLDDFVNDGKLNIQFAMDDVDNSMDGQS